MIGSPWRLTLASLGAAGHAAGEQSLKYATRALRQSNEEDLARRTVSAAVGKARSTGRIPDYESAVYATVQLAKQGGAAAQAAKDELAQGLAHAMCPSGEGSFVFNASYAIGFTSSYGGFALTPVALQAVADAANICCKTTAQFLAGLVMFFRGDSPDKLNSLVDAFKQDSELDANLVWPKTADALSAVYQPTSTTGSPAPSGAAPGRPQSPSLSKPSGSRSQGMPSPGPGPTSSSSPDEGALTKLVSLMDGLWQSLRS
ncbi:hypothetical protein N2152v2_000823 [Parachlorella kessleri]